MSSYDDLIDVLKHLLFNRFYPMPSYTKGLLGDGLGNVEVPGRPDKSFARFNRGSTEYFEIFNVTVPQVNDWPVKIGEYPWAPGLTQVVGTDWELYEQSGWGDILGNTPAHAPTHEWPDGSPGSDPVDIFVRSIVPLRGYALTGTVFYANSLEYEYQGSGHVWGGLPGINLAPVISDTVTGTMRYAGVYLDPLTNGLLVVTGSTTVHSSAIEPPLVSFPQGVVPVSRIRIYGSQTYLSEADIREARRLFDPVNYSTGTVSGGSNVWADAGKVNISTTEYATWTLANAALGAGDQAIIGEGSQTSTAESVANGADIRGSGIDVSVLTGTGLQTLLLNDGTNVLQDFNIENTATGGRVALSIGVSGGADGTCINVKGKSTSTSGTATGIRVYRSNAILINCLGEASGGSSNYALYVDDSATGTTTRVYGGEYTGDVYATGANATIELYGPRITGTITAASSATIIGEYFDSSGNLKTVGGSTIEGQSKDLDGVVVIRQDTVSDSTWIGAIQALPGGAAVRYTTTSGDEEWLKPFDSSRPAKLRLYNSTQAEYALIDDTDLTGGGGYDGEITLTAAVPGTWGVTDVLSIRSPTNTNTTGGAYYLEYEFVNTIPSTATAVEFELLANDSTAGQRAILHPYSAFATGSRRIAEVQVAGRNFIRMAPLPLASRRFTLQVDASGASTFTVIVQAFGYRLDSV